MLEQPFETVIFTQADEAKNQALISELKSAVERREVKIIDIRRIRNQLVVTFRRLST
ncbi:MULTISPECIES: hypothetical protein [Alicyclobacillus]|uniref:Uncharacterized protein n=1 Tax=Alicyclobacillus acidoterrestris (strain ATCC 49025 / DSM 3922 / CIP 106132 / NCIMB 13137 / GD3B) TaxID=1356854 RepID=T0BSW6_ALIAG|nr:MULTISPECIES: hypothetical protein [Alicyclobacillus]EPZ43550.1 hypothetical protein N007_12640 [Alicyclobacillus acidoterrestris ATCC 49025]UNO50228.1 hypothetical protein K1I37_07070 [Alicyclobacillus acidoterrestris]GEO25449.1 hypothetical protein AAC03nite_12340 [Alicyclobacillus acidoterrestris]